MLKGKSLLDYTIFFSPNEYANWWNINKIFSITEKVKMGELYCIVYGKYRKFEKPKISYILEKTLVLSIICSKINWGQLTY